MHSTPPAAFQPVRPLFWLKVVSRHRRDLKSRAVLGGLHHHYVRT
jgi:hypothetical protein